MESKFKKKGVFESAFDSFEFDDGFLMKVDLDLKEYKADKEEFGQKNVKFKELKKEDNIEEEKVKKILNSKTHYYDSPLFIEDLNESEFFFNDKKNHHSPKVVRDHKNDKVGKESFPYNFTSCLSPIQGPKSTNQMNLSSSTPVRSTSDLNSKETVKQEENSVKSFDYVYLEADLFDDWCTDEVITQKSTITMSQALKLIEEEESAKESDQKDTLNQSIDLLTGEVVSADVGIMFDESFGLPKSEKKQLEDSQSSNDCVIISENCEIASKPLAAQKLNFENCPNLGDKDKSSQNICFSSDDDDFDFLTQDILKPIKNNFSATNFTKQSAASPRDNLNDSTDGVIQFRKKRGKCFNIIESDSTEDSPSPKFRRKNKMNVNKRFQKNFGKEFIDSEAEVSDEVKVSSDESEEDGEYDKSFLDEESYFTQNCSANMTSKYLESVKAVSRPGCFKIPPAKPYNPLNVFSQIPEENNTDYEIDSFCVSDVDEETNTDMSDLEVAEKILEMDKKKRRKKKLEKSKKFK